MIPILYYSDETAFTSNGIGRLTDCISCKVTEERNGIFECEFQYPVTGKHYQQMVDNGGIISVIHDDNHDRQAFDIYRYTAPIDGIVTFYAHHISYRMSNIIVEPFSASSCSAALAGIKTHSVNPNPFTYWTDKSVTKDFEITVPHAARAMLGGVEGSILDVFGTGEYKFDNWNVYLYVNRGVNTQVTIRYGKNLTDIERDYDESGVYSAIAPYYQNDDGTTVYLSDGYVVSPHALTKMVPWTDDNGNFMRDNNGNIIFFSPINIVPVPMDFTGAFATAPSQTQLRNAALAYMENNKTYLPDDNIKIDFVQLWQTPEYENVAALQRVGLCDTISVYYPKLGIVQSGQKVIKVVYDVLLERFESMEIGKLQTTLSDMVEADIDAKLAAAVTTSALASAIQYATQQITGGLGGNVVLHLNANGEPDELLIMDTDDTQTAVNVWRWNQGGLGHSHNGYNGPFSDVALTQDGRINANMITAGTLDVGRIAANSVPLSKLDNSAQSTINGAAQNEQYIYISKVSGTTSVTAPSAWVTNATGNQNTWTTTRPEYNASYPVLFVARQSKSVGGTITSTTPVKDLTTTVIDGGHITTGTIDASRVTVENIDASKITTGKLTAGQINGAGLEITSPAFTLDSQGNLTATSATLRGIFENYDNTTLVTKFWEEGLYMRSFRTATHPYFIYTLMSQFNTFAGMFFTIDSADGYGKAVNITNGYITLKSDTSTTVPVDAATETKWCMIEPSTIYFTGSSTSIYAYLHPTYGLVLSDGSNTSKYKANGFSVSGTKSRHLETKDYGTRQLYAFETPTPMFADIGEGTIDEYGSCRIWLDPVFAQTIGEGAYQVFLQKYGDGDLYVAERHEGYFVVNGTAGLTFAWEIKAKQRDFEEIRMDTLERFEWRVEESAIPQDSAEYLIQLKQGRISK